MPDMRYILGAIALTILAFSAVTASSESAKQTIINPPPTASNWADLGKLPDWSGVWNPHITDQDAEIKRNPTPWTPQVAKQIQQMDAEQKAGKPRLIFFDCLPEAHPSWMLVSHNAMEILFTPGRVTMLGESDGNRLRRIYTDGRPHPSDPDPTFHGHSIGHWEGDTLVVDTVAVLPQAPLAISEAHGVPNNGELHTVERIHLADRDILHVELEIFAPHVLTRPWKTTRMWFRQRARRFDIVEGNCLEGNYNARVDENGNHIFVPIQRSPYGNVIAPK